MNPDDISYTKENTHIPNSYLVNNKDTISAYVDWIIDFRKAMKYTVSRSKESYIREWLGHNKLYELGLYKSHTKDVDLNENNSVIEELIWLIIGGI